MFVLCTLCLHLVVACGESQGFNQSQNIQRVNKYESDTTPESTERDDEITQKPIQNVIKKPVVPTPSSKAVVPSNPILRPTDKKVDSISMIDDY